MRANNVIIVTSGQAETTGIGQLDAVIQSVLDLKKNPIVVLGPDGDDLLRTCTLIDSCDLVFDPNFEGSFFSSVKAGLHATSGAAFVVALSSDDFDPGVLIRLERELLGEKATTFDLLETVASTPTSPVLVTARGVRALKQLAAQTDWRKSEMVAACAIPVADATP